MDTSIFSELNWLAILVAAIAYFLLGALWYSVLFGKLWIKSAGIDINNPDAKKGAAGIMMLTLVLEFVTYIGLAILVDRLLLMGAVSGVKLGLLTGICFSAISITISYLYQMKPRALSLIDSGYHIVGQIAASIILCVWQ